MKPVTQLVRPALYDSAGSRQIEQALAATQPPHGLMAKAGLRVAQLALALAPHAQRIWIACGPGNNGGDGMVAALHLQQWGKQVVVTHSGDPSAAPPDAQWARAQLQQAHIPVESFDAALPPTGIDFMVDALLGLGSNRPPSGTLAATVAAIQAYRTQGVPVLAVDLPTGLMADTGHADPRNAVQADHTLCLVALRPGLFTAMGKALCGRVWLEPLSDGDTPPPLPMAQPVAWLGTRSDPDDPVASGVRQRSHASHKGQFGDVAVVGGAPGMRGAAVLAAQAALATGAGRVFVSFLNATPPQDRSIPNDDSVPTLPPDLMVRPWDIHTPGFDWTQCTVVAGCGGGTAMAQALPLLLSACPSLVLDADALNALASTPEWQTALQQRQQKGWSTVLTPHPKEAARLLGVSVAQVQQDRLNAVRQLALQSLATVVLKGSGTWIASAHQLPVVNPTGNGKLAIAGTGDVLAGMVGTCLAHQQTPQSAAETACYWHGWVADQWPMAHGLTASELVRRLPPL